ncbi:Protocadherin Fat 4 [Mactra antiquata]
MFKNVCVMVGLITVVKGITFFLWEEMPMGTFIGNVASQANVTSESCGNNKIINFYILQNNDSSFFSIDSQTGNLMISKIIDRDVICSGDPSLLCNLSLSVVAICGDFETFVRKIDVNVIVEDINDNAPMFPNQSTVVRISEAAAIGSRWLLPTADDRDSNNNSVQWYDIVPSDVPFGVSTSFDLHSHRHVPSLVVTRPLDREVLDLYSFSLIAIDSGIPSRTGSTTVNVVVEDINDNTPVFEKRNYPISIYENYPSGQPILNVMAFDIDIGTNAMISYQLSDQQPQDIKDTFHIDSARGILQLAKTLNNGTSGSIITVLVEAVDHGVPPLTGRTVITITVNEPIENVVG